VLRLQFNQKDWVSKTRVKILILFQNHSKVLFNLQYIYFNV
jgi:hypothetical protein